MIRRKKVSAKKTIERIVTPGDASAYITHDGIQKGDRVVLFCRVSTRQQNHSGNLEGQEHYLTDQMHARGAIVVCVEKYVGSGLDPLHLIQAAKIARQCSAKIVALTTDRFIRHEFFKATRAKNRQLRVNQYGLELLQDIATGVELVTLEDPNASLSKCAGLLKRVGQIAKGRKGGRPKKKIPGDKKKRRQHYLPRVYQLCTEGHSNREIARRLNLPESTVRYWVRNFLPH